MSDITDKLITPSDWDDQIICRRKLDESRGQESICECLRCKEEKEAQHGSDCP